MKVGEWNESEHTHLFVVFTVTTGFNVLLGIRAPKEEAGMDVARRQRHTLQDAAAYEELLHLWSPLLVQTTFRLSF